MSTDTQLAANAYMRQWRNKDLGGYNAYQKKYRDARKEEMNASGAEGWSVLRHFSSTREHLRLDTTFSKLERRNGIYRFSCRSMSGAQ